MRHAFGYLCLGLWHTNQLSISDQVTTCSMELSRQRRSHTSIGEIYFWTATMHKRLVRVPQTKAEVKMKNVYRYPAVMLALLCVNQIGLSQQLLLGQKINDTSVLSYSNPQMMRTSHGQFTTVYPIRQNGIEYLIAWDKDSLLSYILTLDRKFKTAEGYKIGTSYRQIKGRDIKEKISEHGYGERNVLRSGWSFVIVNEKFNTGSIRFFYKK